jgi:hypothetical protein
MFIVFTADDAIQTYTTRAVDSVSRFGRQCARRLETDPYLPRP